MRSVSLLLVLLLAACGGLPRPFQGNPGASAMRLAQPPPARLVIPPPTEALLSDTAAASFAGAIAGALRDQEVPALVDTPRKGDWQLQIAATLAGGQVTPGFTVLNPAGEAQGSEQGRPVPAAQWSTGAADMLKAEAQASAPAIGTLLTRIEAARRQSDPNSLVNRATRIWVKDTTGAPGDGNPSLTRQMKLELTNLGDVVQDTQQGADYAVEGHVNVVDIPNRMQRVEIVWAVQNPWGAEQGKVVQLNEVPAGTLSGLWSDVAVVVAKEAAGGVQKVIENQIGKKNAPATPPKPPAP